ncbi:MAG: radical SAM protein [Armatimonadota bacterium]|nr:radical SAM protein [Armatimonadota bacterium]MDR7452172.1 radical SAM protein [Armatimonadota bacterium]MDR7468061.1 radical SAM protein [Armatimonadota bacterium]MDR7494898.1 radical SAM protein [Armatimonadota bacterium]MDR7500295.1 radical SAM protein [Armatimonadota bacterium]
MEARLRTRERFSRPGEQRCALCGRSSPLIAAHLGICGPCVRARPAEARQVAAASHTAVRRAFRMPSVPPRAPGGVRCGLCLHDCVLGEGDTGYCGLRTVQGGRLVHLAGVPSRGLLHWYRDPLPTNCVAMWACAGRTQRGEHNLAVFYGSCTLNCLFCQNWHYRDLLPSPREVAALRGDPAPGVAALRRRTTSAQELAAAANAQTFCVCYFGGDPASQMPHALASAALLARRGVVVCWETSGTANTALMDRAVELSLQSGGTVKFDLKAFDETLHIVLTGHTNRQTLANFARAAGRVARRPEPPLVAASTLLVPGYVDAEEVGRIARFIASFCRDIPYALLGFAPNFYMPDLPCTSVGHAEEAAAAARDAGLTNVRIGNRHVLSRDY